MSELQLPALALQAKRQAEATPGAAAEHHLVVGVADIPVKEQLLLRSLLRVMDGKNNLRLKFSDTVSECNVVLVPAHWSSRLPPTCVSVHLIPEETPADSVPHPGLSIRAPLRLTNTSILLKAAAELLDYGATIRRSSNSLAQLLTTLLQHTMSRERRTTVLPLKDGREITVNFLDDCYYSPMPVEELLKGRFSLNEPRRASDAEIAALAGQPSQRLRELLWLATNRLIDSTEPSAELSGHFRLRRWPDAMGLTRAGMPMLAALLTKRALTMDEACRASGASVAAIGWFLKTNLALGIAESVEMLAHGAPTLTAILPAAPAASPSPASSPSPAAPSAHTAPAADPAKSMLSRLRDRLKLW